MFARPTVLQVRPGDIPWARQGTHLSGYDDMHPFDFDNMPAAWLDAPGSDEFGTAGRALRMA